MIDSPRPGGAAPLSGVCIDFYGLGELGMALATRLVSAGATVRGIDIDPHRQARWTDTHPGLPGGDAQVVILCVTDDAASQALIRRTIDRWQPGTLLIEHGTGSPASARATAARCAEAGVRYADAPLSGGAAGARLGTMVAMLGVREPDQADVANILSAYCARVVWLGEPGTGQTCKLANQLAIAGIAAGLTAAQRFSAASGLDLGQVFTALSLGTAGSVQLDRLQSVLSAPDTNAADVFAWLRKDLDLCTEVSDQSAPLASLWRALWDTEPLSS